MDTYHASDQRYNTMPYRRCGTSGLQLSCISLGLWHNFGSESDPQQARQLLCDAFDLGITHFDLANNYGPPPGSAESCLGSILGTDLAPYRDELIISTKAGYRMWPGPYGDHGSRKYLLASLDASLRRLAIPYVDIFYHHRPDFDTPLSETMGALAQAVRGGKALYAGISNYPADRAREAAAILAELGTPCLIHQPCYNMFRREPEGELLPTLDELGIGCIAFSPLAQGLLTDKYLQGIPSDSRAGKGSPFLNKDALAAPRLAAVARLNALAQERGQSLAQMALAWVLRHPGMTSALIGASKSSQLRDAAQCLQAPALSSEELAIIDHTLSTVN